MRVEQSVKTARYDPQVELPELPDDSEVEDRVLLGRIRRQDAVAYSIYYARHASRIYGRLLALLVEEAAAADVLEELFVELWERRRELAKAVQSDPQALLDRAAVMALSKSKRQQTAASTRSDDHKTLVERCRALDTPDLSDEAVRQCIESILADARDASPPASVRGRMALRLGHPDVEKAARRYAQIWPLQLVFAGLVAAAAAAVVVWLVWR